MHGCVSRRGASTTAAADPSRCWLMMGTPGNAAITSGSRGVDIAWLDFDLTVCPLELCTDGGPGTAVQALLAAISKIMRKTEIQEKRLTRIE